MEAADTGQTAIQAGSGLGFEGSPRAISAVGEFVHEALESGQSRPRRRRGWLVRRMLLAADLVGLLSAFLIVQAIYKDAPGTDTLSPLSELAVFVLFLPLWIVLAKVHGLYDRDDERTDHSTVDDIPGVFRLVTIGAWLTLTATWLTGFVQPNPHRLLASWALAIVLITLSRALARAFCRRRPSYLQNTIVVGAGDIGQLVARKIMNHPEYGLNIVGFVDATPKERREDLGHLTLLGGPDELPPLIPLLDVERVVVAFSGARHEETLQLIRSLKHYDVQIDIVPRFFEIVGTNSGLHGVEGLPLIGLPPASLSRSSLALKRAFDVTLSLFALIVLAPLLGLIAVVIKFSSPGPVFFRQIRVGKRDRHFTIYKFRTMVADADERKPDVAHLNMHARAGGDPRMFKVPDDPRVTRVGRYLRRYCLDELPQLFNVLAGDMSLVGPRPLIVSEDCCITPGWARERLNLRPGVTGLWQVLGSSDIPFEEMTRLDYVYVTSWSLWGDICLILRTLPALVRTRAAY